MAATKAGNRLCIFPALNRRKIRKRLLYFRFWVDLYWLR